MASAGQGSPLRSQLALKLKPNTPKKAPTPSPTVQVKNFFFLNHFIHLFSRFSQTPRKSMSTLAFALPKHG